MTKLRNFFNPVSNDNRLFTAEEVGAMSPREFAANEKAIDYQMENVGVPRNSDLAGNSDVVYVHEYTRSDGTKVKAHYRSKHGGTLTGAAAKPTGVDKEFDRYLNYQIKDFDTGIPKLKNYSYYYDIKNKLEYEVGDFLRENTNSPKVYSNDLRPQYASAIFSRNLGQEQAKWLGDLNENFLLGRTGSGIEDTEIDQINNEIGRKYGLEYPNMPRHQLLKILLNDWDKNSQYAEDVLKKKRK